MRSPRRGSVPRRNATTSATAGWRRSAGFCEAEHAAARRRLAEGTDLSPRRKVSLEGKIEGLYVAMSAMPSPPPPSPGPDWSWEEQSEGWVRA